MEPSLEYDFSLCLYFGTSDCLDTFLSRRKEGPGRCSTPVGRSIFLRCIVIEELLPVWFAEVLHVRLCSIADGRYVDSRMNVLDVGPEVFKYTRVDDARRSGTTILDCARV